MTWSSYIQEQEEFILDLFKDKVWVEFIHKLELKSKKVFEKGEKHFFKLEVADILVEKGYVIITDSNIEKKRLEANKK